MNRTLLLAVALMNVVVLAATVANAGQPVLDIRLTAVADRAYRIPHDAGLADPGVAPAAPAGMEVSGRVKRKTGLSLDVSGNEAVVTGSFSTQALFNPVTSAEKRTYLFGSIDLTGRDSQRPDESLRYQSGMEAAGIDALFAFNASYDLEAGWKSRSMDSFHLGVSYDF